jgi:Tol biopolymer transport system component/tRNA A-37 threonylcarbamoyl transferase component Bud32
MTADLPERFGPYEVVALLGAGGAGEVYRARDPRLNRQVAIKILAHAGEETARQRRLLEEAQAASALNHPNIVTVYDVGTHDGVPFVVSELIEGASLRDLLGGPRLGIREVLDLAVQMADGLAAAHQAGIIHRDFKPENVMVTREGRVKIVDFGLALIGVRDELPTAAGAKTLTMAGTIAGTVPYMSPEQARGAPVDARTDQFSLGLTLYEMLTCRRAFTAETHAQVLAAILEDEPEAVTNLNPRVPPPLRWTIERCLAKDPRQRYDSTADLARELRTLRDRLIELVPGEAPPAGRRRRLLVAPLAVAAATLGVGLLAGGAAVVRSDRDFNPYRFTPMATDAPYQGAAAWSPDGKTIAYVAAVNGVLQVFTRTPGSAGRAQITHAPYDCRDPFWSPDGTRLYFISLARDREGLWTISAAGGEAENVMEDVYRAALSPDGRTLAFYRDGGLGLKTLHLSAPMGSPPVQYTKLPFANGSGVVQGTLHFSPDGRNLGTWVERAEGELRLLAEFWMLPVDGGTPRRARSPMEDLAGLAPEFSWLPDSRHIVSALPAPQPGVHLWLTDTEAGPARLLTPSALHEDEPAMSPDGRRIAVSLQQADYDLYQLSVPHASVSVSLATSRNEMDPAWSPSGTQMAFTTDRLGSTEIWLRNRDGDERALVTASTFGSARTYLLSAPAFSPDGQRLAFNRASREGMQIWVTPIGGGTPILLAPSPGAQDWPSWSADGDWIAFAHSQGGAWFLAKARVGSTTPAEVIMKDIAPFSPVQWSPGGGWIAFNTPNGLTVASPDHKTIRVLHDQPWMAFAWSADEQRLYGIRLGDDFQHLAFTSVDLRTGAEHVLNGSFASLPLAAQAVRGMTRTSPTTFVASIVRVQSDVWLLEHFLPRSLWDRLIAPLRAALP